MLGLCPSLIWLLNLVLVPVWVLLLAVVIIKGARLATL